MKTEQKSKEEMTEMVQRAFEKTRAIPGNWIDKKLVEVNEILSRFDPADIQDLMDGKITHIDGKKDKTLKNKKQPPKQKINGAVKVSRQH